MKLSKLSLAAACLPAGLADFWMVYQRRNVQIGRVEETLYGTSIVSDLTDWTCEADTFSHRIVPDQRDVSGTRYGVQFEPWSSKPGPLWHEPIWIVRMNLYPSALGRQTISAAHNYAMLDADTNQTTAQCHLNRTVVLDLDCWLDHPDPRIAQFHVAVNGSSMFFCETDLELGGGDVVYGGGAGAGVPSGPPFLQPDIPVVPPGAEGGEQ